MLKNNVAVFAGISLIIILLIWQISIIQPGFFIGFIIAYLFNPLVVRLNILRVQRTLASAFVLLAFFAIICFLIVFFLPIIEKQVLLILHKLPPFLEGIKNYINDLLKRWVIFINTNLGTKIDQEQLLLGLSGNDQEITSKINTSISHVLSSTKDIFNFLSAIVIPPFVAFFILKEWDNIIIMIDKLLPLKFAPIIRQQIKEIDMVLSGFLRGQILVCLSSAVLYIIGWSLVGIEPALSLGIFAGIMSFIPFLGGVIALVAAIILTLIEFGVDWSMLTAVSCVYLLVQVIESVVSQSYFIGRRVKLHDVWVVFALILGNAYAGTIGMIFAVPTAAVLGVVSRFILQHYLNSSLYLENDMNE